MDALRTGNITELFHCPFVDLSMQHLSSVELEPGKCFPNDRIFALVPPDFEFDTNAPRNRIFPFERGNRHMGLRTCFDSRTESFTVFVQDQEALKADVVTEQGKQSIVEFFSRMYGWTQPLALQKLLQGQLFAGAPISLINLSTVAEFAGRIGREVNHLRFRSNIYFDGWPAWSELELPVGSVVKLGTAEVRVVGKTVRCRMTETDPVAVKRDMAIPQLLKHHYGHSDLGIYVEVIKGGVLRLGDAIAYG